MDGILSKVIAMIVSIGILLGCVTMVLLRTENIMDEDISNKTIEFVDECRQTGYISPDNYMRFCTNVYAYGNYEIKIEHESEKAYGSSGDYRRESYTYTTEDILSFMFPDNSGSNKNYTMKKGDKLVVTVIRKNGNMGTRMLSIVGGTDVNKSLVVRYGRQVGNSQ